MSLAAHTPVAAFVLASVHPVRREAPAASLGATFLSNLPGASCAGLFPFGSHRARDGPWAAAAPR